MINMLINNLINRNTQIENLMSNDNMILIPILINNKKINIMIINN